MADAKYLKRRFFQMTKKKSHVALVKNYIQLSTKEELIKDKEKKIDEPKDLWKLRRTLGSCGLNPNSSHLMDCAIILDNRSKVEGYLTRANDPEMHYAKRSNGKNAGKIKANSIEAAELKALGLSTTDPRTIANMLANVLASQRAIKKTKRTKRVNNMRALNNKLYLETFKELEQEERDNEDAMLVPVIIDYDAITEFATRQFMPA
jgi:hypothetical protein